MATTGADFTIVFFGATVFFAVGDELSAELVFLGAADFLTAVPFFAEEVQRVEVVVFFIEEMVGKEYRKSKNIFSFRQFFLQCKEFLFQKLHHA